MDDTSVHNSVEVIHSLEDIKPPPPEPPPEMPHTSTTQPIKKPSRFMSIVGILVVVCLVLGVYGIFLFYQPKPTAVVSDTILPTMGTEEREQIQPQNEELPTLTVSDSIEDIEEDLKGVTIITEDSADQSIEEEITGL